MYINIKIKDPKNQNTNIVYVDLFFYPGGGGLKGTQLLRTQCPRFRSRSSYRPVAVH